MEHVKFACISEHGTVCEFCERHTWVGPPASRIPQPMPDLNNPGHYLPASSTPLQDDQGNLREIDDWQHRAYITRLFKNGMMSLNDNDMIEDTARKLGIEDSLVVSCVNHPRDLSASKERRAVHRSEQKDQKTNSTYDDYDWLQLVVTGKLSKLLVIELDKYLLQHHMNINCSTKDKVRGITADVLRKETIENQQTVLKNVQESQAMTKSDGSYTDMNADSEDE